MIIETTLSEKSTNSFNIGGMVGGIVMALGLLLIVYYVGKKVRARTSSEVPKRQDTRHPSKMFSISENKQLQWL